jgi:hypothetical protein
MNMPFKRFSCCKHLVTLILLWLLTYNHSGAQTFNFETTANSTITSGDNIYVNGYPDSLRVWCSDWDNIFASLSTWRNDLILKSNVSYVKFYVDKYGILTKFAIPVDYSYHLAFHIYGYPDLSDTINVFTLDYDTLTINYNTFNNNTPYQDANLKKYNNFYKIRVFVDAIYRDSAGMLVPAVLSDPAYRNFKIEATIETQHYEKKEYGISSSTTVPTVTATPFPADKHLDLNWGFSTGTLTPANYQLEWTFVDDYGVSTPGGGESPLAASSLSYNFAFNSTRVWLSEPSYQIPLIYPRGYIVYRVRAVRPDSELFRYPIYGAWSLPDEGNIGALPSSAYYYVGSPYTDDKLNWQHTINFAEGGKYKNVVNFYDGLLKMRQSITRFNTAPDKLIVTNNVYDFEGRLSIKTLPAPVKVSNFDYQFDVSLNSATGSPYKASDFDIGTLPYSLIPPLAPSALANVYYSSLNPDIFAGSNRFIPSADGYPFVQTVYESGDRVAAQGGAGAALQIGTSNFVSNAYVSASRTTLNSLFGPNVGWESFYTMTVTQDPNQQYSMVIKDYHGRPMVSALIGNGVVSATHAIDNVTFVSPIHTTHELLSSPQSQVVDSVANMKNADVDYFNEVASTDSLRYSYSYSPYEGCPGRYIYVKGSYSVNVTDQMGNLVLPQNAVIGYNGVAATSTPVNYASSMDPFTANIGPYHISKKLSFSPWDIEASLDSFFHGATCFFDEPHFIKESVEARPFPCPPLPGTPTTNISSDPCAKAKWEMMQQLFPNAIYGKYSMVDDSLIGTNNSIYTIQGCGIDTYHVTHFYPDSVFRYCYHPVIIPGEDSMIIEAKKYPWGFVNSRCHCSAIDINDTCVTDTVFNAMAKLTMVFLWDSTQSIYIPFKSVPGDMTGSMRVQGNWNLGTLNGDIYAGGSLVGSIVQAPGSQTIIRLPVVVNGNNIFADIHANALSPTGDSVRFTFVGQMGTPHVDSMYHFAHPFLADSLVTNYSSPLCHYRYQDTCTIPSLPNTIVIGGVTYTGLRTMPAPQFNFIYRRAIAAGDYSIAEALLPLHPQYCELNNCYTDSFRTWVLTIPDFQTADSLGLLYLDDLVAHDPLKDLMISSGVFPVSPADSLRTFRGGDMRLDSFIFISAYCACGDSIMYKQCCTSMFNYEIVNHLLINDKVKKTYFQYMRSLYFGNRQRFIDSILHKDGNTCSHCALARMTLDPTAPVLPVTHPDSPYVSFAGTGGEWIDSLTADLQTQYDSTVNMINALDADMTAAAIDSIVAHLSNCIAGISGVEGLIRTELNLIHSAGLAPMGNFTYAQLATAIQNSGISLNDICNPYIYNLSQRNAPPGTSCNSPAFYTGLGDILSMSDVLSALSSPGGPPSFGFSLDSISNSAGRAIAKAVHDPSAKANADYDPVTNLYTLYLSHPTDPTQFVKVQLHSPCGNIFTMLGPSGYTITTSCIGGLRRTAAGIGLINQYSFVANLVVGGTTTCSMTGWMDEVKTMSFEDDDTHRCITCVQLKEAYMQFKDSMTTYNIMGVDHPYYGIMLKNFMNDRFQQQYTYPDYLRFMQSCALGDHTTLPLYCGYATVIFNNTVDADNFISSFKFNRRGIFV